MNPTPGSFYQDVALENNRMEVSSSPPISFFGRQEKVEELQRTGVFPVFNDPMESVRAMRMLLESGRKA